MAGDAYRSGEVVAGRYRILRPIGAGGYPLDVMRDPSLGPLTCAMCRDQRVRGSGRCVGDDASGKRLPGAYLCRQIVGPKP